MANKYLITLVLSTAAGVLAVAILYVVWPVLEPLPVFLQYAITGVGGAMFAIYLADATREALPLVFEPAGDDRLDAMSFDGGQ